MVEHKRMIIKKKVLRQVSQELVIVKGLVIVGQSRQNLLHRLS